MTDEHLDRLIRDADPFRPDVIGHLDGVSRRLLEDIVSVPTLHRVAEPPGKRPQGRRGLLTGIASAGVAAAILAGFLVVSTLDADKAPPRQATPTTSPSSTVPAGKYSLVALQAAEKNPRLLINQPGWKATTVYGFVSDAGTVAFTKGSRDLEINWYPESQYDDYYQDRLHVSKPERVKVDERPGELFRYSESDFAVMLRPHDGFFVELRTGVGGDWTRGEFDRVLATVIHADVNTWLAALPAEIVTPERVKDRATTILADVPLPPGFSTSALQDVGTNDSYQFGAEVVSRVTCGWIAEWRRAKKSGDSGALTRANDAFRSSHHWKILKDMNSKGDYPEVIWETADKIVVEGPRGDYKEALGCS